MHLVYNEINANPYFLVPNLFCHHWTWHPTLRISTFVSATFVQHMMDSKTNKCNLQWMHTNISVRTFPETGVKRMFSGNTIIIILGMSRSWIINSNSVMGVFCDSKREKFPTGWFG
jgi:hypothetical protein